MTNDAYTLAQYISELRTTVAETQGDEAIVQRVRPLARRLVSNKDWVDPRYYSCDEEQGFGVHLLHEEPDHTLAVFAIAWLPKRGTPAHDHGTWAVVAGIDGDERNTFWKRLDDGSHPGYAELKHNGERVYGPGEVVSFLPGEIHTVWNDTDGVTLSLHTYGKHINFTGRSQFDPERRTETPFVVKEE